MKDQAIIITALNEAASILSDYLEPGPRDPVATINRLIKVLDNQKLAAAMEGIDKVYDLKVVKRGTAILGATSVPGERTRHADQAIVGGFPASNFPRRLLSIRHLTGSR
jgi:hypothetical protein